MSGTERSRRSRERRTEKGQKRNETAASKAELEIVREFQGWLDSPHPDGGSVWPSWREWEGRTLYNKLWQAFAAGWTAGQK